MARIETDILINKSVQDVFAFLNVAENHAKFIPGMLEFRKTSPGPLGAVGATARGIRRDLGRNTEVHYEITEVEPNMKLGMQGAIGPLRFKDGYVLEPMRGGTRVKFWLELTISGLLNLARPLITLIGKTHAAETLSNLKKVVEAPR